MTDVFVSYLIPVIHVVSCLFLIVVVLLQTGKGADMGAVFGGGSQTLFGSGGAGNLLTKLTTGTAIAFMITSLILSYGQSHSGSSLLNRLPAEAPGAAPATPPTGTGASKDVTIPVVPAPAPAPAPSGDAPADTE